ncbi:GNAT family N-acetyltransferase [Mesobacillus jeotgali]|uniref:GNAT family N-acetyltransferase n=1 Tax=Mesobacillus jeotgali TaxID=129985 RepID=UPI0009A7F498|nr:GNAT family N-acetyltransferase [Mesobacillus jeotgali]
MLDVEIRRPITGDTQQLNEFFKTVITDTFTKEGIGDKLDDMNDEIETKKEYLSCVFDSNGEKRYFLIALYGDRVIGTIEYGPVSDLIKKCTNNAYKELIEVGTVFVHPDFQSNGVGNLLLKTILLSFKRKGIDEFCLDSGYTRAQGIWKKKFGEPDYLLKDQWGKGHDHMIWRIKANDCL